MKVGEDFEISEDGVLNIKNMDQMQNSVQQLVDNVGIGKALVAEAITEKGVETAEDATFQTMASNIGQISVGVDKDYVDNADIEVKRTSAKAHSTKYDETVIPAQYANKLYVYDDPESMYKASETGEDSSSQYFSSGEMKYKYHSGWDYGSWNVNAIKKYDETHIALAVIRYTDPNSTQEELIYSPYNYYLVGGDLTQLPSSDINSWTNTHSYVRKGQKSASDNYPTISDQEMVGGNGLYISKVFTQEPINTGRYPGTGYFEAYVLGSISGLPIFDVDSQSGIDAFNNYQATGDYSGAVNASELNPRGRDRYCAIDVNTGDWYNIINDEWVKQGTLELNSNSGELIYNNTSGSGEASITLSQAYTNYNQLVFRCLRYADSVWQIIDIFYLSRNIASNDRILLMGWPGDSNYVTLDITDSTHITRVNEGSNFYVAQIYGL